MGKKKKNTNSRSVKKPVSGKNKKSFEISVLYQFIPVLIVGAAFILRFIYFLQIKDTPFFITTGEGVDQNSFLEWGQEIAQGNWLGTEVFNFAPLYAYILGFLITIFGKKLTLLIFLQLFTGAGCVYYIYRISGFLFNRTVAVTAGIIAAFYGPFMFYETQFLSEPVSILLFLAAFYMLLRYELTDRNWKFFFSGILFGLSVLARPHLLIPLGFIIVWYIYLIIKKKYPVKRILVLTSALACLLSVTLIRNYVVANDAVLITAHGGMNIYIGNNINSTGSLTFPDEASPSQKGSVIYAQQEAERLTGKKMKPSEVSNFWMKKGLGYIITHPFHFIGLSIKKMGLLFSSYEIPINISYEVYQKEFSLLKYGTLGFWLLSPLTLMGIVISIRKKLLHPVIWMFFIGYASAMIMFYVTSRYRIPAIPFCIIVSAAGIYQMYRFIREKDVKEIIAGTAIFLISFLLVNFWIQSPVKSNTLAIAYYNLGNSSMKMDKIDEGIQYYNKALELDPGWSPANKSLSSAYNDLGVLSFDKDDLSSAIKYYEKAIEIYSNASEYYFNLGNTLLKMGKYDDAIKIFDTGLIVSPDHISILTNIGAAYSIKGLKERRKEDFSKAKTYFEKSLLIDPDQPRARRLLNQVNTAIINFNRSR